MVGERHGRGLLCLNQPLAFSGLGINLTLTCLQALGIYPLARQAVKMAEMSLQRSTLCYKSAGTISSLPVDLNGLNVHITHQILD